MKLGQKQKECGHQMIKAEPLAHNINHKDILDHAQKKIRKEREIIGRHLTKLEAQVKDYLDPSIEYSSLNPMTTTATLHTVLKELYGSNEGLIKKMKEEIKEKYRKNSFSHNGERCPYCGILRQSSTVLDHFLPRAIFPEYSILARNLVYICERCNNAGHKGSLINDSSGKRLFLHPYTDEELERYSFLECNIEFDDLMVIPTFTINEDISRINKDIYDIACNHMKTLKLNKRYGDFVESDLLYKFRNKFTNLNKETKVRHYRVDLKVDDILSFINDKIEECDETDLNNWELVFWKEFLKATEWFKTLAGRELENRSA